MPTDRIPLPSASLVGRHKEMAAVQQLLVSAASGGSGIAVVRGPAGIGKTALLDYSCERAEGFQIVRVGGTESEMELAFAGLHQLCMKLPVDIEDLPEPQCRALKVAFGSVIGPPPDRFLVGLAVLSLLAATTESQPCLCLVDDAQWLDQVSRQVLSFVARRLEADSIVMLFGVRSSNSEFAGLPEICLEPLSEVDASRLLESVVPTAVSLGMRSELLKAAGGIPLAVLELPKGLTPVQLVGGFAFGGPLGLTGRMERTFEKRIASLPEDTQILLLIAAAEPTGDPDLLWRAAELLGITQEAAGCTELDGLTVAGPGVIFRHPLVRSAVYERATPSRKREVHRALAEASNSPLDSDRRAWHRALASVGPDESIAVELEASASDAARRGGLAAAAAFLGRAVLLTADSAKRCERALSAAETSLQAGDPKSASRLLEVANSGSLSEFQCARLRHLDAQIRYALNPDRDTVMSLLEGAEHLERHDLELARESYLEAMMAALRILSGAKSHRPVMQEIARRGRPVPQIGARSGVAALLLDGLAIRVIEGYEVAFPRMQEALRTYMSGEMPVDDILRWWEPAWRVASDLWDDEAEAAVMARVIHHARNRGSLLTLPRALYCQAMIQMFSGEFDLADSLSEEADAITAATGRRVLPYTSVAISAWRGRDIQAATLDGYATRAAEYCTMVLATGHGRYELGLEAARECAERDELNMAMTWPEIVEIACRCGDERLMAASLATLRRRARSSGSDLATGILARSEALSTKGAEAEPFFKEAILHLDRARSAGHGARAHLLYGEWLRRMNRRLEARAELRSARDALSRMGALAFSARAEAELLATGERIRKSSTDSHLKLTPRESQIARLAAERATNAEIAARLFISPSTVDYHLRKVFQTLNVSSRRELANALPELSTAGPRDG